jgi:hypothetical protein
MAVDTEIETYHQVNLFSNSFLSRVAAELSGKEMPAQNSSFYSFGKEYEDALLFNKPTDNKIIKRMVSETHKNSVFKVFFDHPELKLQHEYYGKFMGLPFKAKADMVIKGYAVPDIKSTVCATYEAFVESIAEYGYDRQMYIYMELFKCSYGCLIATTKSMNPKVFVVPVEKGSFIYESGKQKTEYLISVIESLYLC